MTSTREVAPRGVARLLAGANENPTLANHLARFGALPGPDGLVELVAEAGLRGRGGGAFPTATKLAAVAAQGGRPLVVANAVEGEPLSRKDRSLLRVAPHLVLDGASLAARAIGADRAVIATALPAPELETAVFERSRQRLDPVALSVERVASGFVAGEETAVVQALARRGSKPTLKPPYPFERGLEGRPTLVQNVETFAHLALIARYGPEWFAGGTLLVTLGGAVARPGVHEVPLGASLPDVISACGGLAGPISAYLVGGYFGGWVAADAAHSVQLTPDAAGAGAIVALPASTCPAAECARVVRYLSDESAGQCGPCVHGLAAIADAFADARRDRRGDLERWTAMVAGRGACRHPDGAARFVRSALTSSQRTSPATRATDRAGARSSASSRSPHGEPRPAEASDRPDRLRRPRALRRALPRADRARRLGLPDPRSGADPALPREGCAPGGG